MTAPIKPDLLTTGDEYDIPASFGTTNRERPSDEKLTLGFTSAEKPESNHFNWEWDLTFAWLTWFVAMFDYYLTNELTASTALIADADGKIDSSSVTSTELEYVSGVTSAIQTQLNERALTNGNADEIFSVSDGLVLTNAVNLGQLNNKQNYTTYCANSGNTDVNGYADIITKVSDTEVSFKVGSSYANLGITFPNGKHYEISSIANITGISADGVYKIIIQEDDLINLYDGTYSVVAIAFNIGYSADVISPIFTSATKDTFTVGKYLYSNNTLLGDCWNCIDGVNSTYTSFQSGTIANYMRISCSTPIILNKVQIYSNSNPTVYCGMSRVTVSGSNDGTTWTVLLSSYSADFRTNPVIIIPNTTAYSYYSIRPQANLVGGYSQGYAIMNEVKFWYPVTYEGGNITEEYVLPTTSANGDLNLLINQNPLIPQLFNGSEWTDKQFVKIGEVTKSTTLGTPISYAFNGEVITSKITHPSAASITSIIHNLGTEKTLQQFSTICTCKDADQGWSVGDVLYNPQSYATSTSQLGIGSASDNTILYACNATGLVAFAKSTGALGALVESKWDLQVNAKRGF